MEEGKPVTAYETRPILFNELEIYWRDFFVLSKSRPIGFSVGYIPVSEIMGYYMNLFEIKNISTIMHLINRIQLIDSIYLEILNSKNKEKK